MPPRRAACAAATGWCSRRGRRRACGLAAERECQAVGADTLVVPTDVADPAAVVALFTSAVERFGLVDAVVHSVTVVAYGRFEEDTGGRLRPGHRHHAEPAPQTWPGRRSALFRTQGRRADGAVGSLLGKIAVPVHGASYVTAKWALAGADPLAADRGPGDAGRATSAWCPRAPSTPRSICLRPATYQGRGRPAPAAVHPPGEGGPGGPWRALDAAAQEIPRSASPTRWSSSASGRLSSGRTTLLVPPLMRLGGLTRAPARGPTTATSSSPRPGG